MVVSVQNTSGYLATDAVFYPVWSLFMRRVLSPVTTRTIRHSTRLGHIASSGCRTPVYGVLSARRDTKTRYKAMVGMAIDPSHSGYVYLPLATLQEMRLYIPFVRDQSTASSLSNGLAACP